MRWQQKTGNLFWRNATRYMVETACRVNAPAEWVKGMGLLIGHLEKAPEECRMKFEKQ